MALTESRLTYWNGTWSLMEWFILLCEFWYAMLDIWYVANQRLSHCTCIIFWQCLLLVFIMGAIWWEPGGGTLFYPSEQTMLPPLHFLALMNNFSLGLYLHVAWKGRNWAKKGKIPKNFCPPALNPQIIRPPTFRDKIAPMVFISTSRCCP